MSMVITQYRKKTYISLTYFEGQFSEEKMDEISGKIVEALSPDIYPFNRNNTVKQPDVFETILKNLQTLGDAVAVIDDTEHSYSSAYFNTDQHFASDRYGLRSCEHIHCGCNFTVL
jgi:hypothetical protein